MSVLVVGMYLMSVNLLIFMLHWYVSVIPLLYDGVSNSVAIKHTQLKTVCGTAMAVHMAQLHV